MGRHEQQAIATAAGISDMAVAAQLFGGTQSEFTDAAANQEALQKRAIAAQSAMDQMKNTFMGLAVAVAPLVETLTLIATWFAEFMSAGDGTVGVLMSIGAAVLFVTGFVISYQQAMVALSVVQGLATAQKKAAIATELAAGIVKRKAIEQDYRQAIALGHQDGAIAVNSALKKHNAEQEAVRTGMTKLGTTANYSFAASLKAVALAAARVGVAIGIAYGVFKLLSAAIKRFGPIARVLVGILAAVALAAAAMTIAGSGPLAMFTSSSIAAGWAAAAAAGVGLGAGAAALMADEGLRVPGKRGDAVDVTAHADETILSTHKKSDDQAVADAEAKGHLSLTKDKGFEEVTQAINNLVAKLNTMITQSEERAAKGAQQKAVEVTMELDRDKVGEATATWLEEKYGWTGA
jgi:hypothetical protein